MSDLKKLIPGCFGEVDREFAVHGFDEDRAFELLKMLREKGTSWEEARGQFRKFLQDDGCSKEHINRQMKRIREHMRPWLR